MAKDPTDPLEAALRENRDLRERVAELERLLGRFGGQAAQDSVSGAPLAEREAPLGATLAEREALLSEAERIAHLGSWVWNIVTDDVLWSDELFRILGYDPATDRASSEGFFARVHPDDLDRVRRTSEQSIADGIGRQVDYRVLRPDGTVRYVTMGGALLFDSKGELRRAVGTVLDVTEAREAARQLRRTAELLSEAQRLGRMGSFELELRSQTLNGSDQLYQILDLDPAVAISLDSLTQNLHPDDQPQIRALLQRAAQSGVTEQARARLICRGGELRHLDVRAVSAPTPGAEGRSIRGTVSDVTNLVQLEAQFHESQKLEAMGQLAGGLAHDYNNLLTVVMGNAELLQAEGDRQELREIVSAANTAQTLTRRLLTLGRKSPEPAQAIDLSADFRAAREILERVLGDQIDIECVCEEPLWPVRGQEGQLQQILLNLALNARDAMPDGGTLRMEARRERLASIQNRPFGAVRGDYVTVTVTDSGVGMDELTRMRAFEPFFTTKGVGEGSGLGLAMVFSSMKQCDGFVELGSEPGRGTAVKLWYRRAEQAEPARAEPPEGAGAMIAEPISVLLVEDDPTVARVTASVLEGCGYRVRVAPSPSDALRMWDREPADVLVTDVVMPQMSGEKLADALEQRSPGMLTLFATGYAPEDFDLRLDSGRRALVLKPFHRSELMATIARLRQARRARADRDASSP